MNIKYCIGLVSQYTTSLVMLLVVLLLTTLSSSEAQLTDPIEVKALLAVKQNLNDPRNFLKKWDKQTDPCTSNWTGVSCFNTSPSGGYLHVRELLLLSMRLTGTLSPELGQFSYLEIMDFMWNKITGSIPKEIGNIKSLKLLLLNGNELTGSLPDELGFLPNLDRIQVDQNFITGPLPKSFANLNKIKHFHINNNSISGSIPPEIFRLPSLVHLLLDNNNLSGPLPPDFSRSPNLTIIQLDNNHFDGGIPASYSNMKKLLKLSLRNCSLTGPVPDMSRIPNLAYIDLSSNQLNGSIPSSRLSDDMTTINRTFNPTEKLILDFQNNSLSDISGTLIPPCECQLLGNPVCMDAKQLNIVQFCWPPTEDSDISDQPIETICANCHEGYERVILVHNVAFFCAVPLKVEYRLKSPGFSDFRPYEDAFNVDLSSSLSLELYQIPVHSFAWEKGPRLTMHLNLFPNYRVRTFNESEIQRIRSLFTGWKIHSSDIFGPYELKNFKLGSYACGGLESQNTGLSNGAFAGIILGVIAGAIMLTAQFLLREDRIPIKADGVKGFTFEEMALATYNFDSSTQVGQGGYGKVYKGVLSDGSFVAIKRAQEGSFQGDKDFFNEIELLSRVHHRNLVSLIGYCYEESEQLHISDLLLLNCYIFSYADFMPNGTLRDHLSAPLSFAMRLRISIDSAKGILYLHTDADPPIFHRDVKSSNILICPRFSGKVADFGLSRLAPVPDLEGTTPGHVSTVVKGTPVNEAYNSGTIFSVIDEKMGSYPSKCIEKFGKLALQCCQEDTDARPSMAEVVKELDNILYMMPESDISITVSTDHGKDDSKVSMTPPSSSSISMSNRNWDLIKCVIRVYLQQQSRQWCSSNHCT
ncbi:hypothetical protein MKW98_009826 [Papaver atlanticum]|uniref:non-specific serine/threonine protein kinase n=1 Tax=Papaver atlanticum TaxID=357466 RepID=A0AAD4SV93_9MAGN|nr:hypothetical protein MKW98_009826 [Papaver atlanticum]